MLIIIITSRVVVNLPINCRFAFNEVLAVSAGLLSLFAIAKM